MAPQAAINSIARQNSGLKGKRKIANNNAKNPLNLNTCLEPSSVKSCENQGSYYP
jgi:hypothetical protein